MLIRGTYENLEEEKVSLWCGPGSLGHGLLPSAQTSGHAVGKQALHQLKQLLESSQQF